MSQSFRENYPSWDFLLLKKSLGFLATHNPLLTAISIKIAGIILFGISMGIWGYIWMKTVVYPPLPDTITNEEKQKAQIER